MLATLFVKDARLRPIWRVLIYAIAVVFLVVALGTVYLFIRGYEPTMTFTDIIAGEVIMAISAVVVAPLLRRYLDRRSTASLGFALRGPWTRLLGIGILFGAGMQIVVYVIESAAGAAHVTGFGTLAGDVRLLAVAIVILFAAAFFEEMSFRGYPLQNLWEEWGFVPAVVITSIAFAGLHASNPHALERTAFMIADLVAFAVWACMSLYWTKSLWLALGAHMAWNLFEGPVLGLPLSGVTMPVPTVLSERVTGPAWLTGGSFGPEAGASSLIALVLGFVVLRVVYVKGGFADVPDTREAYARAPVSESSGPSSADLSRS